MDQRRLGRSGLSVSRLGLGTGTWATLTDATEAADLLTAFAEAGGTLIDTAGCYANGHAEELLGTLLGKTVRRTEFVLATAAGLRATPGGFTTDASRRHLLAELDWSLARLDTDHVDLWQVHLDDAGTDLDEALSAMDFAIATGRTRYVGVVEHRGWRLARAATRQERSVPAARIISAQVPYSLLCRGAEAEVLPAASACGAGVLATAPLAGGVLTGKYRTTIPLDSRAARSDSVDGYLNDTGRRVAQAVATAAEGLGVPPAAVALSWMRGIEPLCSAILGARTVEQLRICLTAEQVTLPAEILAALDEISRPQLT